MTKNSLNARPRRWREVVIAVLAAAGLALVGATPASAFTWAENGDAGSFLASAQAPAGSGPLDSITGSISADEDLYRVCLTGGTFTASTSTGSDPMLILFDERGNGLEFNDDSDGGLESRITFNATPGTYYLAIVGYPDFPLDANGGFAMQAWGGGPLHHWYGSANGYAFNYTISLSGAQACGAADSSPPVITPEVAGTVGDNGWYTTDADLSWSVTDGESALSSQSGCAPVAVQADQTSTDYTCTATSAGGTASRTVSIKRDAHAPTVAVTGVTDGATYTLGAVPTAGCDTQDATSGVAQVAEISSAGGPVGSVTATCSGAKDNAGNEASAARATYVVHYAFTGFFQPIDGNGALNSMKAGSSVPVKFSLAGDKGLGIMAGGSPSSRSITCSSSSPTDAVEETSTAGASSLSYDAANDRYSYVWKTEKAWAGTCRELTVKLDDGTSHTARFKFTK